ncbi:MAG: GNAT family N-acetyltransferase [Acidobacteriota bacterium]
MTRLEVLLPPVPAELQRMTFPAYRHLLGLEPARRLPAEAGRPPIQPFALAALDGGEIAGLLLGELPISREGNAEVLSVFVDARFRRRGIATRLLEACEQEVARRGHAELAVVFTAGAAGTPHIERILDRLGWPPPVQRTLSVRFTVEQARSFPWLNRYSLREGAEIFPWRELQAEERRRLVDSQSERGWIAENLVPWRYDEEAFEPVTSLGMRLQGEVVGWVINHATGPRTLRFTCAYIRKDLGRRGRLMPLVSESIDRIEHTPFTDCTFVVPLKHQTMVAFVRRWMEPWAGQVTETRGSTKRLDSADSGPPVREPLVGRAAGSDPGDHHERGTAREHRTNPKLRGER